METIKDIPGIVIEIGCAYGVTTLFLNNYMDWQNIDKDYYCIDTFSGFTAEDIQHEIINRGKSRALYKDGYIVNKKKWFDYTMRLNRISRVKSIQADANQFDFSTLGDIAYCLLDVDLYLPIKNSLPILYRALSPGGVLLVHDCNPDNLRWDGADQAYREFVREIEQPEDVQQMIGVIRKPL